MIINAYAVLDSFVTLIRLGLGIALVVLGASAWKLWMRPTTPEGRSALEDRSYLMIVLAIVLLGLNLASWPLFYLLLQSYVSEWPGVMCIYGVTQIGAETSGISRFLPRLVKILQVTKPALVFVSGTWLVLYLANRRTTTAPLTGRVLLALLALGLLAVGDAAAEAAYLVIPKKEESLAAGCCTEAFDSSTRASRFAPEALLGESYRPWLSGAYWAVNLGMIAALFGIRRLLLADRSFGWLAPLVLGDLLALAVSGVFLIEIAAPTLLHLPYHHCPYDLLPKVPESVLGIVLFLLGSFAVGWACVAGWLGACPQTRPFVRQQVARLLLLGLFGYLGSLVILSIALTLA
jgi:hypothetical protein